MLLVMRIVAVRKLISVFVVVPNIQFVVDGNNGAIIKKSYLHVQD